MDQKISSVNIPMGITIYPEQKQAIDKVLSELLTQCPTKFNLLAEESGQLIASNGELGDTNLIALSSLIAGDMSASQEIANLTGQYESFQLVLREGRDVNTFICEVGDKLFLFVQVEKDVPLGYARLLINEASNHLVKIVSSQPTNIESLSLTLDKDDVGSWVDSALNSLWKE